MTDPQQVIGEMQLRMDALASQMQALNIAHQRQAQQNAQLQQEKQELDQRLTGVMALLQQSLQQTANVGVAQGQVPPLQSAGTPAGSSKPVNHIDVLKCVKQPQSLKDRDQWERFSFQVETYLALLDENFPADLDNARKLTSFVDPVDMTDEAKSRGRQLFAMLNSWTQELAVASKIARGIRDQNGFEFWRLLWREIAPDNHSKSLIWRRSLLSPKIPAKEAEFSAALQEWEADLDKYEAEYGPSKAISDEDKRAVVLTEAPTALKQHLSMHIGTLSTYQSVREVVVSYLQAKQVWRPSAAYAGAAARTRDPDAMDISLVGDGKGKGKGKDGKGKDNKKGKGKEAKGKGKDSHNNKGGKGQQEKDRCAICWKTGHTIEKCWFNSKGQPKGKGKKGVAGITEDNASVISAGPSASQVGGQSVITLPSTTTSNKGKNVGMIGEHRLLMVKATSSGQHRHVSPKAILAIPEGGEISTGNAILAKESLVSKLEAIFAYRDQPGWHDPDPNTKVFVVKGKNGATRKYATPGSQYPGYTFRSTWQWNEESNAWDCKEFRKKWKLLHEPHETFQGTRVWALQVFQRSDTARVAKVASRGTLLVDTGACSSVCRPEAFPSALLDPNAVEELYTVDDTPLKACGEIRPQLRLGDKLKEEAQVTFQVVEGVNENILSVNRALDIGASVHFESDNCYIQWADGRKATFARQGKQFLLPFEELEQPTTRHGKVAAIDEDAMAVEAYAMQEDEEAEAVQEYARREEEVRKAKELLEQDPGLLADLEEEAETPPPVEPEGLSQPISPTEAQVESHRLTHLPFQPWCEECVSGKAKQDWHRRDQSSTREGTGLIQMDYFFLSPEKEEEVEDESRLVTILCLTDTVTGWPLALQLPNKSTEVAQSRYCLQNVDLYLKNLGYNKVILQHDGEPSISFNQSPG